jgi:hypothetical protein
VSGATKVRYYAKAYKNGVIYRTEAADTYDGARTIIERWKSALPVTALGVYYGLSVLNGWHYTSGRWWVTGDPAKAMPAKRVQSYNAVKRWSEYAYNR